MNFMNKWEFMHIWTNFWKFHSYMHEFPLVHKIHKFDHGDDLVIMAMTDCWSFMIAYIIMSSWNISWPLSRNILAQFRPVEKNPSSPFVDQLPTGGQEQRQHQGGQLAPKKKLSSASEQCHTLSHNVTQRHSLVQCGVGACERTRAVTPALVLATHVEIADHHWSKVSEE